MSLLHKPRRTLARRLMLLFFLLIISFTLLLSLLYNALMRRQTIAHYSQSMQRDAYAVAQNLSEWIAPSSYDSLDETRFIVSEETLTPYLAFIEQLTHCTVYIVDSRHNVTGYFSGVVQTIDKPLLPNYMEQCVALGFMGKTPFFSASKHGETHLATAMPVMNEQSRVLGVVMLVSTLREQGFAQVPSANILLISCIISFVLSTLLAGYFSARFTRPISALQKVAKSLADGDYQVRTAVRQDDEIGSLAQSMDILADRLEDARQHDEQLRIQQQQFFSNISHELRTPVTVIRASLEALSDGVVRGEENTRAYYRQMISESQWLQRLILDLLELSRLQNLDYMISMEDIQLSELLSDVAMSAGSLCGHKGVRFLCEEPSRSYVVKGDYSRLRQMLLAVIDNAVKFTPAGKSIHMMLSSESPVITIRDEGVGISPDDLAHIFDRFHHTQDSSHESTGLGLSIVREIARRHDVSIGVTSREGEGTTFTFTFPA